VILRLAGVGSLGALLACSSCGSSDATPAAAPSGSSGTSGAAPALPGPGTSHAGGRIFPTDNAWNTDVTGLPVDAEAMRTVMPRMSPDTKLHPDWGSFAEGYGIPITVGNAATPAPITWTTSYGPRESDKLACPSGGGEFCYPIPLDAKIEGGGDRHVLFLARDGAPNACTLYELFATERAGSGFRASSGAIWKLDSNARRPEGFTSADAAGLPILAGLVRREEIERGEITHALRFTLSSTRNAYIHPATHAAGKTDATLPPMGLRVRLKASFSEAGITGPALVILRAMKRYGLLLADNGSNWYISGETSDAWDMGDLNRQLGKVKGADFEIVKTGPAVEQPD